MVYTCIVLAYKSSRREDSICHKITANMNIIVEPVPYIIRNDWRDTYNCFYRIRVYRDGSSIMGRRRNLQNLETSCPPICVLHFKKDGNYCSPPPPPALLVGV